MPITEEDSFFIENIVNINKRIYTILFCAPWVLFKERKKIWKKSEWLLPVLALRSW